MFTGRDDELVYVSAGSEDADGERTTLVRAGEAPEVTDPVQIWVADE